MASIWDDPYVKSRGGRSPIKGAKWSTIANYQNNPQFQQTPGGDFMMRSPQSYNPLSAFPKRKPKTNYDWAKGGMRNEDSIRNKIAINQEKAGDQSIAGEINYDNMSTDLSNQISGTMQALVEQQGGQNNSPWYTRMWEGLQNLGPAQYGNIAKDIFKSYVSLQDLDLAKQEFDLAEQGFNFQKAAWNKDYDARKIAYNTNAENVNAWKKAQGRTDFNQLIV